MSDAGYDRTGTGRIFGGISGTGRYPGRVLCPWRDFSEGVDLTGESLIGAVIVGTGLPQIGSQREILKEYYDKRINCGFDYAYRYPGMNKVLQAAGRVIRTKEDKGVILLLDDRFWDRDYQEIFPREWQDRTGCRLDTVEGAVETFWKRFT